MMLVADGLTARYGQVTVLQGLSLSVAAGSVCLLLGRNGAGKSTTLKTLIGLVRPAGGSVRFEGVELAGEEPFRIARRGIGYVPEERRIFSDLTVIENLEVGARTARLPSGALGWTPERLFALFPNLAELRRRPAGRISGGEQQMLAIARTLMGNPRLLLLDEPSEGLSPLIVEHLADTLLLLKREARPCCWRNRTCTSPGSWATTPSCSNAAGWSGPARRRRWRATRTRNIDSWRCDMMDKIRCDACPVMCLIADGMTGACDRYANAAGELVRVDPHVLLERAVQGGGELVPFLGGGESGSTTFVTAIGAGTTYPDYKPAPFIVSSEVDGIDMVTVVTEGIFSYCGVKVKIDTDRFLGPERSIVRADGEAVGHVTTGEYGSQMLSLGGVHHLTGGSKREGMVTCETLLALCNRKPVKLTVDDGAKLVVAAGQAPVIDGVRERRMRVGCGSATIGMFAKQFQGLVDEVVVVDDHITGVVSEHQSGKVLGWQETGIRLYGRRSTPGRYFHVAQPGTGWGGTDLTDPLAIVERFDPARGARPGITLFMVSTTGEHAASYVLDEALRPVPVPIPAALDAVAGRIRENCEPALATVLFIAGAGGSLRAGVTDNPVRLTWSVKDAVTRVTCGGAPVYVWPGGGITFMVDVSQLPSGAFGSVPTPALVAPVEFSLPLEQYVELGGHVHDIRPLDEVVHRLQRRVTPQFGNPWPLLPL